KQLVPDVPAPPRRPGRAGRFCWCAQARRARGIGHRSHCGLGGVYFEALKVSRKAMTLSFPRPPLDQRTCFLRKEDRRKSRTLWYVRPAGLDERAATIWDATPLADKP